MKTKKTTFYEETEFGPLPTGSQIEHDSCNCDAFTEAVELIDELAEIIKNRYTNNVSPTGTRIDAENDKALAKIKEFMEGK